nr:EOG090X089S [Eurycercus lamellatus]
MLQVPMVGQQRYAARKGTRERKEKKKVKTEIVKKEEFVPYAVKLAKLHVPDKPKRINEDGKPEAIDDVFFMHHFKSRAISFSDAIQFHRECNDPTVFNSPNSIVSVKVELDMRMEKKNRYLDTFSRLLLLPNSFDSHPPRKILAFCKTQETQDEAIKGGADATGGAELIKRILSGEIAVADYDYFVAHTNMMAETLPLRGLLRKKLPVTSDFSSMGVDLAKMIERFSKGIEFTAKRDAYELDYGEALVPFGRLTMPVEELEANYDAILKDIETCRGRSAGAFITRCLIQSRPNTESFLVDPEPYVGKKDDSSSSSSSDDESDDDEEGEDGTEKTKDQDEDEAENPSRVRVSRA